MILWISENSTDSANFHFPAEPWACSSVSIHRRVFPRLVGWFWWHKPHNWSDCLSLALYIENFQSCECLVILKLYLQWTWSGIQAYQRAERSLIASTLYTTTALSADTELDSLCQLLLSVSPSENYVLCSFKLPNSSWKKINSLLTGSCSCCNTFSWSQ